MSNKCCSVIGHDSAPLFPRTAKKKCDNLVIASVYAILAMGTENPGGSTASEITNYINQNCSDLSPTLGEVQKALNWASFRGIVVRVKRDPEEDIAYMVSSDMTLKTPTNLAYSPLLCEMYR